MAGDVPALEREPGEGLTGRVVAGGSSRLLSADKRPFSPATTLGLIPRHAQHERRTLSAGEGLDRHPVARAGTRARLDEDVAWPGCGNLSEAFAVHPTDLSPHRGDVAEGRFLPGRRLFPVVGGLPGELIRLIHRRGLLSQPIDWPRHDAMAAFGFAQQSCPARVSPVDGLGGSM